MTWPESRSRTMMHRARALGKVGGPVARNIPMKAAWNEATPTKNE